MSKLHSFLNLFRRYKYVFVVFLFALLVGVVDENSFLNRYYHQNEIRELKSEIRRYTEQYERDSERLRNLNSSHEAIVREARERYLMKRSNEDVFVFVEEVED